jgi:hypothetical protein
MGLRGNLCCGLEGKFGRTIVRLLRKSEKQTAAQNFGSVRIENSHYERHLRLEVPTTKSNRIATEEGCMWTSKNPKIHILYEPRSEVELKVGNKVFRNFKVLLNLSCQSTIFWK